MAGKEIEIYLDEIRSKYGDNPAGGVAVKIYVNKDTVSQRRWIKEIKKKS